jgi:pyridoxamine 5'-phosphate oxidase
VSADPLEQFERWHREAGTDAVCLATASADGAPSARIVLFKGASSDGFLFHSNRTSRKGRELAENPRAALVFHWPPERQVRVTGTVELLDDHASDEYWASRPRASQLGAWASPQSEIIAGREELESRLAEVARRFGDSPVERPPFWGGYRVVPETIEFWHHRDDRLHDRLLFTRTYDGWASCVLAP